MTLDLVDDAGGFDLLTEQQSAPDRQEAVAPETVHTTTAEGGPNWT